MQVGNIVKFKPNRVDENSEYKGYYRVRSIRGEYANLTGPFGNHIYHKRIPLLWLWECETEWYAKWSQSETYQCM